MTKIFLVDDHVLIRAGMQQVLGGEPDLEVVGEASDGWEALRALGDPAFEVDVLVLDLSMPQLNGIEVLRRLQELRPKLPVLVVSMYAEAHFGAAVLAMGAAGYMAKDQPDLALAIRAVASGRSFISRRHAPDLGVAPSAPHQSLTGRELQVFVLLIEGRPVSDIAAELGLGVSTVSTYIGRIRAKLEVESVAEIVRYACQHGLVG